MGDPLPAWIDAQNRRRERVEGNGDSRPEALTTFPPPGHPDTARRHVPGRYERLIKPAMDGFGGALLAIFFLPVLAVIALAIRFRMGSPVLLRQERVGQYGQTFRIYKFRTMEPDRRDGQEPFEGSDRRRRHKSPEDPRITPLGAFLRRWSLDELPQFWNIILGDMSLVGPRPELVGIVETYQPWQHRRHQVKPGVTGLWQISERRNGLIDVEVDLVYIDRISLRTDLSILLRTPAAMLRERGY